MKTRTLRLTLSCAALLGACQGEGGPQEIEPVTQELTVVALKPTSDVTKTSVVGVGDTSALFRDVDDGTSFSGSDGDTTYVRSNATTSSHRVGYSGAPAGTVTQAVVSYRARTSSASGTAQVKLFDGSTLVGTGAVRTLGSSYANFTETFSGLNVGSGNNLRTEITFKRTSGTGNLRYTLIWISVTVGPDTTKPAVSITAPAANAAVRGTVPVTVNASDSGGIKQVELFVDDQSRGIDTTSPFSILWDAFHDTYDSRSARAHKLTVRATDMAGNINTSAAVAVRVVPAAAGDCNGDGVVNSSDITAIGSEINDGDGNNTENTPNGTFAGNPACDANEDNVIDGADQMCAQLIINNGAQACLDLDGPLVKPIIFVPTDFSVSTADVTFVSEKVQETRRFYAKNNGGHTFRALPVEVVQAFQAHQAYWIDGQNFELGVLQELQARGYPAHVDWAQTPWNRVAWVWGLGAGAWAGGRHYPTGAGFSMIGDAVLYAGMDLDCHRVTEPLPAATAPSPPARTGSAAARSTASAWARWCTSSATASSSSTRPPTSSTSP
jgi:hypothetical protein